MNQRRQFNQCPVDLSDKDILSAMKKIDGYIDITPSDFKVIYQIAYQQAVDRLHQQYTAADVMTRTVITVQKNTTLLETAIKMAEHGISGVPVIDEKQHVIGVISEKDFLREMSGKAYQSFMGLIAQCLNDKGCLAVSLRNRTAKDMMTVPAVCVKEDISLSEVAVLFEEHQINRSPVVNPEDRLVGIVTRTDLIQHICTLPA